MDKPACDFPRFQLGKLVPLRRTIGSSPLMPLPLKFKKRIAFLVPSRARLKTPNLTSEQRDDGSFKGLASHVRSLTGSDITKEITLVNDKDTPKEINSVPPEEWGFVVDFLAEESIACFK